MGTGDHHVMLRREPSMSVSDVADRFGMTTFRVYQLSRASTRHRPIFQRLYTSHARFEISLTSISAYEAHIASLNAEHEQLYRPIAPLDFRRGVSA